MAQTTRQSDFALVKELAAGQWDTIIGNLYPQISKAVYGAGHTRSACPVHVSNKGPKADGFRVFRDFAATGGAVCNTCGTFGDGIALIAFLEGQESNPLHAVKVLKDYFGITDQGPVKRTVAPKRAPTPVYDERQDPVAVAKRRALISDIWENSIPLSDLTEDSKAMRYLMKVRGCDDYDLLRSQSSMRYNEALYHSRSDDDKAPVFLPGIVSLMQGAGGEAVGIHRIYLDPNSDQKAPVDKPKKILGTLDSILNGAVRIDSRADWSDHANVCEGIETGMAIAYATGHPVYAAGFTALMASWEPPEGVHYVTVWADRDANDAGINHALKLKARMEAAGIACRVLVPCFFSSDKEDWNDVLLSVGFEALEDAYSGTSSETDTY